MKLTVGRIRKTSNGYFCDIEPIDTFLSIKIPTCSELTITNIRDKWEQFRINNDLPESTLEFSESTMSFIREENQNMEEILTEIFNSDPDHVLDTPLTEEEEQYLKQLQGE